MAFFQLEAHFFPLENELQEDVPYMAHFRGESLFEKKKWILHDFRPTPVCSIDVRGDLFKAFLESIQKEIGAPYVL